ncbi:MAG: molybdenum cofactor guanylyltransferase [Pseudomonadota bacterium]
MCGEKSGEEGYVEISAYITAGGSSLRFNEDKSLYSYHGKPLIRHVYDRLSELFPKVCVVANDAAKYVFLHAEIIPDRIPGLGPLGGLYTALDHAATEKIFFCGCDMPCISAGLIRHMIALSSDYDVVVPVVPKGYEPLHAVYAKRCLAFVKDGIESGCRKIIAFYPHIRLKEVAVEEMQRFGNWEEMLCNINYKHEASESP